MRRLNSTAVFLSPWNFKAGPAGRIRLRILFSIVLIGWFPSFLAAKISRPELLTVTEDSFTLYWETDQATGCRVEYGGQISRRDQSQEEKGGQGLFHLLKVNGLKPGTEYFYQIKCGKEISGQTPLSPEKLTTLTLPDGKLLFSFAVMNDLHINEEAAGLMLLPGAKKASLTPGFKWKDPNDPYWNFTNRSAVRQINGLSPELVIVNGDLTSWFTEAEFKLAKQMLDGLQMPYYPLRGNHDRQGAEPEDWFKKAFHLERSYYAFKQGGFLFICLDSIRLKDGWEEITPEQWTWLENTLKEHTGVPSFIFSHYPLALGGAGINKNDRKKFLDILSAYPQIIACFYGHKHGAKIGLLKLGGREIPQILVPTTKEYPAGFALVRVFENGIVYNFQPEDCENCLEWRSVTMGEYSGMAPRINGGTLQDRNFLYPFPEQIQNLIKP